MHVLALLTALLATYCAARPYPDIYFKGYLLCNGKRLSDVKMELKYRERENVVATVETREDGGFGAIDWVKGHVTPYFVIHNVSCADSPFWNAVKYCDGKRKIEVAAGGYYDSRGSNDFYLDLHEYCRLNGTFNGIAH